MKYDLVVKTFGNNVFKNDLHIQNSNIIPLEQVVSDEKLIKL